MRILIFGAGVIGSLYGALLAEAGYDVSIYARGRRLERLTQDGLLYKRKDETKVQGALSRLLLGKTVLVIAHRMRTVEAADKIVVLSGTISFSRSVSSEALLFLDSPTGTLSSFRTRSMLVWTRKLCSIWPAIITWVLY